jgi:hypothetical protein
MANWASRFDAYKKEAIENAIEVSNHEEVIQHIEWEYNQPKGGLNKSGKIYELQCSVAFDKVYTDRDGTHMKQVAIITFDQPSEKKEDMGENKKLYYQLSDNCDVSKIVMELSGTMEWIKNDEDNVSADDDPREYTITPIWLTDEEFSKLPEADL